MTTTSTESVPEQASASLEKQDFIPAMVGTTRLFDDLVDAKGKEIVGIRKLTFHAESVLNGLQVDYQLADGGTYQAPLRGKAKGRKSVVQLAPEEALVQLKGWGGPGGIARLTLTLTSNTGQERVVGPFGTGEQSQPGKFPPGFPVPKMPIPTLMPHGKTLGGTSDQGFSYFGMKAAAFHGQLGKKGLLVGLGVHAAPLVTSDDDVLTSSVLVEDFRPDAKAKHEIASFSNYRSIVTLPPGTEQLDLWAEEELQVTIGTREYTLDPVRKTTVKPNAINKVVIDIDAKDVACPALKLKTATMTGPWQWISLHPDSAAHEKIAGWSADTLHANKAKLGIDAKYSKEECAHVQSAVTNLAKASAPAGNERRLDPAKMDHSDWVLDLGGPKVDYKALSPQEASQLNATAKTTTKAQSALNIGKWLKKKTGSVTKVVVSTAKNTVNDIGKTAGNVVKDTEQFGKDLGKAAEHAGKEFLDNAEQVGKDFEKLGKTGARMVKNMGENLARGDFDEFGKDFVRDGSQLAMDVAVTGFDIFVTVHTLQGEALMFVLDHTGKFGKVIGGILRAVGTAIVRLVEFLRDPQNWKAIIKTQKALIETVEKSLDSVAKVDKAKLKKLLGARLDQLEKEGTRAFDAAIKKLGGDPDPSKLSQQVAKGTSSAISTVASTVSDALSKPLEALDWLLSKLLDAIPGLSGVEKLISSMLDELKDVLKAMSKALKVEEEQLASLVGQAISDLVALAKDPVHAPELIACMFLNFLKGLLAAGFDLAKGLVDVVIDAMSVLLKFFARLLTGRIDIPGISDLYKFITGQPLTLLGLLALLVAVPTTLIHVMVFGDAPDFQARLASGSQEKAEKGMAIAAYSCAIVESFLVGYLDYRQVLKPARSQELARTESLKTGDNPDDAVGVLDFVKNADTFPIEVASLALTILNWGCSAPLQWNDKNLEEDATWCWGAVPIVIDIYSMCSSGSRLVRAMETHGPLKDMLLTAVDASLVIKKIADDPDSTVGTVPDILSVVGGTGQAAMLYSATKAKGAGTGLAKAMVGWDVLMGLLSGSTGIALVATGKA
ncbi:hypothetical protein [Archangium violaceum]|uniref:Uncharacterized protein n=1 Tax=Archangium violaceum Cb vi76 TaxID=1406225 RepID=A0A084SSM6_9BACT|nr:hypothetical protein [Archangium violaceum]KFA91461.1 hypothetical protein Q664_21865 [Archangium violaceum Cb vi76]